MKFKNFIPKDSRDRFSAFQKKHPFATDLIKLSFTILIGVALATYVAVGIFGHTNEETQAVEAIIPTEKSQPQKVKKVEKTQNKNTNKLKSIKIVSTRILTAEEQEMIETRTNLGGLRRARGSSVYADPEMEKLLIQSSRKVRIGDIKFPESEIENMLRHAHCESKWDMAARNSYRGGHHSVLQVQGNHFKEIGPVIGTSTRAEFVYAMHNDLDKHMTAVLYLWYKDKVNPAFSYITDGWGPWKATLACRRASHRLGKPWREIITVYQYGVPLSK